MSTPDSQILVFIPFSNKRNEGYLKNWLRIGAESTKNEHEPFCSSQLLKHSHVHVGAHKYTYSNTMIAEPNNLGNQNMRKLRSKYVILNCSPKYKMCMNPY